jgi:aryl-alcohol dehydrogenase-like predicted oxidoreductase
VTQRLALGTVQFGLPYGIANAAGQVARETAAAILQQAESSGVDTLDTAIGYGESEQRLGEIGVAGWRIVSKLPGVPADCRDVTAWAHASVDGTLARLCVPRLYGLLMHSSHDLLGPRAAEVRAALDSVRASGKAGKVGVSVYGPDELDALERAGRFDLVQAPFNLVDRRLVASGWLRRMHSAGTEIHVRSVFLQGLLLMRTADRPTRFARWRDLWAAFDAWLERAQLTPLEACLGFVLSQPEIDRVVVGVDSLSQLRQILLAVDRPPVAPPAALASEDPDLINPARWSSN